MSQPFDSGRRLRGSSDALRTWAVPAPLLPYALHFGFMAPDDAPLARFAQDWVAAFTDLPGWGPPEPPRISHDDGPLLTNDDRMSRQLGHAINLLGT